MVTLLPAYEQKPDCGLQVDYTVTGTKKWIAYDSKKHELSIARTSAINGKYDLSVQASIDQGNISLQSETDTFKVEVKIEEVKVEDNSTDDGNTTDSGNSTSNETDT